MGLMMNFYKNQNMAMTGKAIGVNKRLSEEELLLKEAGIGNEKMEGNLELEESEVLDEIAEDALIGLVHDEGLRRSGSA